MSHIIFSSIIKVTDTSPSLSMMYRWMLTASTNPRSRRFADVRIARRVAAAIAIIWVVLPASYLVLYDLRPGVCSIVYGYAAVLYNSIFLLLTAYGIPIPIMITCSLLIRRNLASKRERREQLTVQQQQQAIDRGHLQRKRDQQALVMLFVQIIVYIISIAPWMGYKIYNVISVGISNKSSERSAIEAFLFSLTGTLINIFPAVSFYLYTLSSSLFRKELFIMLRLNICCKCFGNAARVQPIARTDLPRTNRK